jgi:uncharacterized protein involved in outer membrane biogenesis
MWKKLLRRFRPFAYAILVLAALLVFSRNWIAKTLVERVGSAFLECRLTIESIHIHWNSIEIHQFVLYDARETHRPLVLFDRATIEPTLASGLRNQIWFNGIVVERPHVHLHFDANGQLVSRFPNVEGANPLRVRAGYRCGTLKSEMRPFRCIRPTSSRLFFRLAMWP